MQYIADPKIEPSKFDSHQCYCPTQTPCEGETSSASDVPESGQSFSQTASDPANIESRGRGVPYPLQSGVAPRDHAERVKAILRGLVLVLDHHEVPQSVVESFRLQVTHYLSVPDEVVFFKRAKYLTVAPMAKYLRCDAPKPPDVEFVPSGEWKSWSKSRLRTFNRRNTHLWYSFLQAKRAALPLSEELVLTTYKEHREAMSLEDPLDHETAELVMKELHPVLKSIRRRLREALGAPEGDGSPMLETEHGASTRACFEASRTKGGQLGELSRLVPGVLTCNPMNPVQRRTLPDLIQMKFYPIVVVNGVVRTNYVQEAYGYPEMEADWQSTLSGKLDGYLPRRYTRELWHNGERYTIFTEKPVRLKATIQAVLEPLKVRVISKGEAVPYYLAKPLQKALHGVMREMDCFRLIGRPLCPTDLFDLAQHRVQGGEGQYEWFSIDYSAATDKLSAYLSSLILGYLVEGQNPAMVAMWKAVLAPHRCQYPFPFNQEVEPVDQKNGQLMGSILSFPILCLANLGLYLTVCREDKRSLHEKLKGVLVNGDDMLYVARRSLWSDHVELGKKVGLSMSPGKAYHHPVYANANSACFHYDLANERLTPFSIPFLNSGLYFGQSKVMGGTDESEDVTITSTINRLLEGARPGKQVQLAKQFLHRHSKEILAECRGRNLFLPCSLGGMGVNLPTGFVTKITLAQHVEATDRWNSNPYLHLTAGPAMAPDIREAPQVLRAPWLCGLRFEEDEDGEVVAVGSEKKQSSLTNHRRVRWLLQTNFKGYRLLPKADLFVGTHLCAHRGEYRVESRIPQGKYGNPFERAARRDWMAYAFDQIQGSLDALTAATVGVSAQGD